MLWRFPALVLVRFRGPILLAFSGVLVISSWRFLFLYGECGDCGYELLASTATLMVFLAGVWAVIVFLGLFFHPPWKQGVYPADPPMTDTSGQDGAPEDRV
jgi:polyferredoxin